MKTKPCWSFTMNIVILVLFIIPVTVGYDHQAWPIPPKKYSTRPTPNSYCHAGVIPFCPTGLPANTMPKFGENDTLYVYAMKAPVWEFKFGDLLGKFDIMHDAIGFHHVQSGLNLTMEWYELFQLFNCTFPHEPQIKGDPKLLWCNQGATCAYPGIDEKHWRENGTLVKVSEISGAVFNKFADWVEKDNTSYPIYETWTVKDKPDGNVWFNPIDCASWVLRAFDEIKNAGGKFDQNVPLNYTKILLYSKMPEQLGTYSEIFNSNSSYMNKLQTDLLDFYANFQKETSYLKLMAHLVEAIVEFMINDSFFLYYNDIYWKLPLSSPYVELTYNEIPLP